MQWWNDFLSWINSDDGGRIISTAVVPFVAIIIAGVIGALLGRGATRRLIAQQDRELRAAAVAAMIDAGRTATMWSSLPTGTRDHSDSQFSAADIRLRLLPLQGSSAAADWAGHELRAMRRDSANFSFQADQTFAEYRDRLLEWQRRPARARKLFALDLERFRFEDSSADTELVEQQQRWAAEQAAVAQEQTAADLAQPTAAYTPEPEPTEPRQMPAPAAFAPVAFAPAAFAMPALEDAATPEPEYIEPLVSDPEPNVESEDDPGNELDGVEIAEPVTHEHTNYETQSYDTSNYEAQQPAHELVEPEPAPAVWDPQATQAMPYVESDQNDYENREQNDQNENDQNENNGDGNGQHHEHNENHDNHEWENRG